MNEHVCGHNPRRASAKAIEARHKSFQSELAEKARRNSAAKI